MILSLVMMTMMAGNLQADEAQCRSVLHSCDKALQDETQLNRALHTEIQLQEDRFQIQSKELKQEALWKPVAIGGFTVAVSLALVLWLKK